MSRSVIDNAYWASPGICSVTPDTVGGPKSYGILTTTVNDAYLDNPSSVGAWCMQQVHSTAGQMYRRQRINGGDWSAWVTA